MLKPSAASASTFWVTDLRRPQPRLEPRAHGAQLRGAVAGAIAQRVAGTQPRTVAGAQPGTVAGAQWSRDAGGSGKRGTMVGEIGGQAGLQTWLYRQFLRNCLSIVDEADMTELEWELTRVGILTWCPSGNIYERYNPINDGNWPRNNKLWRIDRFKAQTPSKVVYPGWGNLWYARFHFLDSPPWKWLAHMVKWAVPRSLSSGLVGWWGFPY